ncbi:LuxR C-terminal-related transcriptional regulator [Streptomyces sp. NPDC018000]|uniref:LuxR C-terminal-related transcriptional regulator n=1 Tax=Streptomyces sp. NPDC018000 TaxID=3365028 RepID=UPI0037BC2BAB
MSEAGPSRRRRPADRHDAASAARPGPEPQLPDGLTPHELEVPVLIAEKLSNLEIARRPLISQVTVKSHTNSLFAKAGLRDRAQAVRYAYVRGLAQPPGSVFT